jgi:hypothetical protein
MRRLKQPRISDRVQITPDMRDFLRRRTLPFLNDHGLSRPLSFVLEEVYLQGVRDAVQTMDERPAIPNGECGSPHD